MASNSNLDVRYSVDYWDHPKIVKLKRRLGYPGVESHQRLLGFARKERPDGVLCGLTVEDIEIAARWTGEPGALFEALYDLRLLEDDARGPALHGWEERNPWSCRTAIRRDGAAKAGKASAERRSELREQERQAAAADPEVNGSAVSVNGSGQSVQRKPPERSTESAQPFNGSGTSVNGITNSVQRIASNRSTESADPFNGSHHSVQRIAEIRSTDLEIPFNGSENSVAKNPTPTRGGEGRGGLGWGGEGPGEGEKGRNWDEKPGSALSEVVRLAPDASRGPGAEPALGAGSREVCPRRELDLSGLPEGSGSGSPGRPDESQSGAPGGLPGAVTGAAAGAKPADGRRVQELALLVAELRKLEVPDDPQAVRREVAAAVRRLGWDTAKAVLVPLAAGGTERIAVSGGKGALRLAVEVAGAEPEPEVLDRLRRAPLEVLTVLVTRGGAPRALPGLDAVVPLALLAGSAAAAETGLDFPLTSSPETPAGEEASDFLLRHPGGARANETPPRPTGTPRIAKNASQVPQEGFAEFWALVPRKDGKVDAVKAWNRLMEHCGGRGEAAKEAARAQLRAEILSGLARCISERRGWWRDAQNKVAGYTPAAWLNGQHWHDGEGETAAALPLEPVPAPSRRYEGPAARGWDPSEGHRMAAELRAQGL